MDVLSSVTINHPISVLKSNPSAGLCAICDEGGDLVNLDKDNIYNGQTENYSKMLLNCYNIRLFHEEASIQYLEMCAACVSRLREACAFRRRVEAVDERLRRTRNNCSNSSIQAIINKYSCDNGRENTLRRILLKKRINSEILDKLKLSSETRFNNCLIKKNAKDVNSLVKLEKKIKSKKKKDKKKSKSGKLKKLFKNSELEHHIKTEDTIDMIENDFQDFDTFFEKDFSSGNDSSNDSTDIKVATGFVKREEVKPKKEIFLIPALEPSAKICPICEMVPNTRQSLIRHYYDTHFPSFLCHLCGYGTTLRDSFTGHLKTHKGVKYPCSSCSKTFFSPISRYHHEKAIHRKIPSFKCTLCKATFSHSVTRRKHMFEKHGVECTTYPCSECGKVFYGEHRLTVHTRRSHLQHRPFACSICGYSFFQNCDLRDHMTRHTGTKDFNCDQCGKCFSRRACLMEHLKIHANIRNYRCEVCEKTFVQKVSLKGHMKTHERNAK